MKISKIIDAVLGHRYWAVVVERRGTATVELTSAIHHSLAEAGAHAAAIEAGATYAVAAIVTFRSHRRL